MNGNREIITDKKIHHNNPGKILTRKLEKKPDRNCCTNEQPATKLPRKSNKIYTPNRETTANVVPKSSKYCSSTLS